VSDTPVLPLVAETPSLANVPVCGDPPPETVGENPEWRQVLRASTGGRLERVQCARALDERGVGSHERPVLGSPFCLLDGLHPRGEFLVVLGDAGGERRHRAEVDLEVVDREERLEQSERGVGVGGLRVDRCREETGPEVRIQSAGHQRAVDASR